MGYGSGQSSNLPSDLTIRKYGLQRKEPVPGGCLAIVAPAVVTYPLYKARLSEDILHCFKFLLLCL